MADAMQVWQAKAAESMAVANELIHRMPALVNLYTANGLEQRIAETPEGEVVPGGTLTKERVLEMVGSFDGFNSWLNTPLYENGPTPLTVISKVD